MRSAKLSLLVVGLLCGTAWTEDAAVRWNPRVQPVAAKNLIPNGSFECGTSGWIPCGKGTGWGGNLSDLLGTLDHAGAQDGDACMRIELGPGKTLETCFDCWPPARVLQTTPLIASHGWIAIEKGKPYTLSVSMKADRDGVPAKIALRFAGPAGAYSGPIERAKPVTLSTQWQRFSISAPADSSDVYVVAGPDLSATPDASATVWLDAIQLEAGEKASDFQRREAVEAAVCTQRPGNVYDAGAPCEVNLYVSNTSGAAATVHFTYEAADYFGERAAAGETDLLAEPGCAKVDRMKIAVPGPGYYRTTFRWQVQGVKHETCLNLVVVEPYLEKDSALGINHAPVTREMCQTLCKGGVTWTRDWSPNWQFIEPTQGKLNFDDTDRHINRVLDTGMKVLSILPSNPSTNWASEAPASVPASEWKRLAYAPTKPELLNEFVGKVVSRYKDRVKCWEFLNEPVWCSDFCMPKEGGYTAKSYVALLKGVYTAMKAADPSCLVLGGLSTEAMMPIGDEVVTAGGLKYMDILNLHPYPDPGMSPPEQLLPHMDRILRVMDANGGRKPVWATETGYYGRDEKPWEPWAPIKEVHAAGILLRDERQCGDYTVRYCTILLARGVEKIFLHQGNAGEPNNAFASLDNPVLGPQGVPTKVYSALAGLAGVLGGTPKYAADLAKPATVDGKDTKSVYGYAFQGRSGGVLVAWAVEGDGGAWTLRVPDGAEIRNVVGLPVKGAEARLGESPVYITTTRQSAQDLAKACAVMPTPK